MSAFSADEDMSLLLLAVQFQDENADVDWNSFLYHMSPTAKTLEELQERLQHLKSTDTTLLRTLPTTYIAGSSLMAPPRKQAAISNRTQEEIYQALDKMFLHFTKADVRQPSGQQHLNAGELAAVGVTAMLEGIDLTQNDIFLDIGSGTGSILAQVVLQTPACQAIGLEIRPELAAKARESIQAASMEFARLHMVKVVTGNVKDMSQDMRAELENATVVFCNNIVFQPQHSLEVHKFICGSSRFRTVMLTQRFCPRCPDKCSNVFCTLWKEVKTIAAKTCWKEKPVEVYVYERKHLHEEDSLITFLKEM